MGYAINAEYDKNMDGNIRFHRFRYHMARGFVTPTDHVLDLGCGTGYGSAILSEVANTVIAYDMEQSNIDACREKHQAINLKFEQANLEEKELPPCDVATMFEVLEHLYKPGEFVKKLEQSVSKYIIMSVPLGQELVWIPEANEFQEKGDSTHKSVFPGESDVLSLFSQDWKLFWSFRSGVTFIFILEKNV